MTARRHPTIVVIGAGHWRGEGMALVEASLGGEKHAMAKTRGSNSDRPIVVVTGMGVVTSLGVRQSKITGQKLTSGRVRYPDTITRFPD